MKATPSVTLAQLIGQVLGTGRSIWAGPAKPANETKVESDRLGIAGRCRPQLHFVDRTGQEQSKRSHGVPPM